jgi:hypothetical protein
MAKTMHAADGTEDEAVPSHLYAKLPRNFITRGPKGDVPDYLRMILMCEWASGAARAAAEGEGRRWRCPHDAGVEWGGWRR